MQKVEPKNSPWKYQAFTARLVKPRSFTSQGCKAQTGSRPRCGGWSHLVAVVCFCLNENDDQSLISDSRNFHSFQFSRSVVSSSLRPRELQHARLPRPSPNPGVCSNSCPSSQWCHPTISSSVIPFSSCPQSFPASGSFPMSQLFASGGQSIGVSASASVLPINTQGWFPLELTGLISLLSKGLSRVFNNAIWKLSVSRWHPFPWLDSGVARRILERRRLHRGQGLRVRRSVSSPCGKCWHQEAAWLWQRAGLVALCLQRSPWFQEPNAQPCSRKAAGRVPHGSWLSAGII